MVLDVPRDGASQHFVLQFRVQHAVCAMALQGFINCKQAQWFASVHCCCQHLTTCF